MDFTCLMLADTIRKFHNQGLLQELHTAGLKRLSLGVETGHERGRVMLSGKNGKLDPKYYKENIVEAVRACRKTGITTKGFFMVGLPYETRSEIGQTIKFIYELGNEGLNNVALFPVKVYTSTQLWDEAIKMGFSAE